MVRARLWGTAVAVTATLLAIGCSSGSDSTPVDFQGDGITAARIVTTDHHDESAPLRDLVQRAKAEEEAEEANDPDRVRPGDRESPDKVKLRIPRHTAPLVSQAADPMVQTDIRDLAMPAATLNIDGMGTGFSGPQGAFTVNAAPPDTNGDVGKNHFIQTVNESFAIFSKTGTVLLGPSNINTLWQGFGGGCETNNDGDPVVQYDQMADRWIISQFSVSSTPFLQCIAISSTPDPTGTYFRYSFTFTDFNDYPKLGIWPDGYYFTYNLFKNGQTFNGGEVCAADRAKMLTGAAATQQCFSAGTTQGGILPSDLDGPTAPPAGSPNYVVNFDTNSLNLWKFHVDFATPANSTFVGPTKIPVANFKAACNDQAGDCIPQQGSTQQLATLADRLMYRLGYRNFGDHESLVLNHSVDTGTNGPTGVRWYELRSPGTTPTVFQQNTFAPGDGAHRWMGSVAMDKSGNLAIGYSVSSGTMKPALRYTGRLASDPPSQITQGEATLIQGAGAQGSGLDRWGDYSAMTVDPVDDCTFWFTSEYLKADGTFNWSTRIGSFSFPGCGGPPPPPPTNDFSITASPSSLTVAAGSSGAYTIATAVVSGSPETINLAVTGLPSGATAAFSPTSVTTGGSSTLTITVAANAASSNSVLTVTGTSPSATHSVGPQLNVTGAPPPPPPGTLVVNGDFEKGDLSGWGGVAPTQISNDAHSGSFSAQIGSTGPFSGTATLTQQIHVPATGKTTLTFFYNPHCDDTIRFDWQQAQIRDTKGKRLKNIFNICSNAGTWKQSTTDLTPFKGEDIVIFFGDHDDNFPGDPTYMLIDDVAVTNQ
jgi:hypothetical protein